MKTMRWEFPMGFFLPDMKIYLSKLLQMVIFLHDLENFQLNLLHFSYIRRNANQTFLIPNSVYVDC